MELGEYRVKTVIFGGSSVYDVVQEVFEPRGGNFNQNMKLLESLGIGFFTYEVNISENEKISNIIWVMRIDARLKHTLMNALKSSIMALILFEKKEYSVKEILELALNIYLLSNNVIAIAIIADRDSVDLFWELGVYSPVIESFSKEIYENILIYTVETFTKSRDKFREICFENMNEIKDAWMKLSRGAPEIYGSLSNLLEDIDLLDKEQSNYIRDKFKILAELNKETVHSVLDEADIDVKKKIFLANNIFDCLDKKWLSRFYINVLKNYEETDVLYEAQRNLKRLLGDRADKIVESISRENPTLRFLRIIRNPKKL